MNAKNFKHYFFTGFVILLPVVLTFWVISFLIQFLSTPFMGITKWILEHIGLPLGPVFFLSHEQVITFISQMLSLLFVVAAITLVGAIGRYFFFRSLLHIGDTILHKIPIISSVYKTSRELINTIFSSDHKAFKQVVLIPFPSSPALALGFVTRSDTLFDDRLSIFIPTTPNPTSGYLVFYKKEDVMVMDMKVEEALRFIVSCGVLLENNTSLEKATLPSQKEMTKHA